VTPNRESRRIPLAKTLEAARDLIERVVLHHAAEGSGFEIELVGAIAAWTWRWPTVRSDPGLIAVCS
jgi:hypothetical protein